MHNRIVLERMNVDESDVFRLRSGLQWTADKVRFVIRIQVCITAMNIGGCFVCMERDSAMRGTLILKSALV